MLAFVGFLIFCVLQDDLLGRFQLQRIRNNLTNIQLIIMKSYAIRNFVEIRFGTNDFHELRIINSVRSYWLYNCMGEVIVSRIISVLKIST